MNNSSASRQMSVQTKINLALVLVLVLLPHRLARSLLQLQSLENSGRQVASHHQVVEMKNPQSGLPDTTVRLCSLPLKKC